MSGRLAALSLPASRSRPTTRAPQDRALAIMVCVSLMSHAAAVVAILIVFRHPAVELANELRHPTRLVYEAEPSREPSIAERVHQIARSHAFLPSPASGGIGSMPSPQAVNELVRVRIGTFSSSVTGAAGTVGEATAGNRWVSAIDLTNIIAAAQGNPVLLSYFSAIREQIQRVASRQIWVPMGEHTAGIACVGFTLTREGDIQSASIVSSRSTPSSSLRDAALRIVESAGPFPPFPPSFRESSKTIIIPLEFVIGSS